MSLVEQLPTRIHTTFGGRRQERAIAEIASFETMVRSCLAAFIPHDLIVSCRKSDRSDVRKARPKVAQPLAESWRQVLIEQQLHLLLIVRRRSQSAANARQARSILAGQVGKVAKHVVLRHSRGQVVEDVRDGDAQATNAGLSTAFARVDCNAVQVPHTSQGRVMAPNRSSSFMTVSDILSSRSCLRTSREKQLPEATPTMTSILWQKQPVAIRLLLRAEVSTASSLQNAKTTLSLRPGPVFPTCQLLHCNC